jgi:hypothetical protein
MSKIEVNTRFPITIFVLWYYPIYNNNLTLSFYLHIPFSVSSIRYGGAKTPTQNIKLVLPICRSSKTAHAYQETWVTQTIKWNEPPVSSHSPAKHLASTYTNLPDHPLEVSGNASISHWQVLYITDNVYACTSVIICYLLQFANLRHTVKAICL